MSLSGDTVVVGAHGNDDDGSGSGSAYVFTRSGSVWSQQQKLLASDAEAGDVFGRAVAVSGQTIAIGAMLKDRTDNGQSFQDAGRAYAFNLASGTWQEQSQLDGFDVSTRPFLGAEFGQAIAVDGDTMVVGSYLEDVGTVADAGAAYVYVRNDNNTPADESDDFWQQQAKLVATDGVSGHLFGAAVSISGDSIAIGARGDDEFGEDTGAVYVFHRVFNSGSSLWTQYQKLKVSTPGIDDELVFRSRSMEIRSLPAAGRRIRGDSWIPARHMCSRALTVSGSKRSNSLSRRLSGPPVTSLAFPSR